GRELLRGPASPLHRSDGRARQHALRAGPHAPGRRLGHPQGPALAPRGARVRPAEPDRPGDAHHPPGATRRGVRRATQEEREIPRRPGAVGVGMTDSLATLALLCLSALAAGVMNALAGGGTLLTFPALLLALPPGGTSPVIANATSTVALVPGSL